MGKTGAVFAMAGWMLLGGVFGHLLYLRSCQSLFLHIGLGTVLGLLFGFTSTGLFMGESALDWLQGRFLPVHRQPEDSIPRPEPPRKGATRIKNVAVKEIEYDPSVEPEESNEVKTHGE